MELLLEFVIEFFFEIVIDGGVELQHNERIPKWIRMMLATITILIIAAIIVGCIVWGVLVLKDTLLGGVVMILIGVLLFVCGIRKFLKGKRQMEKLL